MSASLMSTYSISTSVLMRRTMIFCIENVMKCQTLYLEYIVVSIRKFFLNLFIEFCRIRHFHNLSTHTHDFFQAFVLANDKN